MHEHSLRASPGADGLWTRKPAPREESAGGQGADAAAISDAEARFNALMDKVGEAVVVIDDRGRVESFSAAAVRMFGYQPDEVIGHNVTVLMTSADAGRHDALVADHLRGGRKRPIGEVRETWGQRKNGEVFPIELTVGEVSSGSRLTFIGVIRDISQRKQVERELRESESRFRDLVGSASDWFWETDVEHRLTFVSERIAQVLGVKPAAILGATFFDLGLDDQPEAASAHRQDLADRQPFRDRVFHVGPPEGHDSHHIRISGIPVLDAEGEFRGYRGVGVDVTREILAERKARQAQQQLADAIESISDGIAVYDADDRLVLCNGEYRRVFAGLSAAIYPGSPFEQVLRANPAVFNTEGRNFEDWAQIRLQHHRQASGEPFIVRMSDGRWILHREYRMADGGVVGIRTDITEMKRREQEIEALRRRYKLILDSAGDGIVGLDGEGCITFANQMAASLLGHDPEAMIGQSFHALAAPARPDGRAYPAELSPISESYRTGAARQVSNDLFQRMDGSNLPVDYFAAPMAGDDAFSGAVLVFRDVTLRLQYERSLADNQRELERQVVERTRELSLEVDVRARTEVALRESRERMKAISDSLFEGVLVVNRDGHVVFANPSAKRQLDLPENEEVEGLPLDALIRLDGSAGQTFADSPWGQVAREGGTLRNDDAVFSIGAGKTLPVAFACSALVGSGGTGGAIISFRDIADLKQAQRDALQASRMASVGQLAAGVAHEINTPIQYIGDNLRFVGESFADVVKSFETARALVAAVVVGADMTGPAAAFVQAVDAAGIPDLLAEIPVAVLQSLDGAAQVGRIVQSMKEFSHPGSTSKTMTDINRALDSTLTVSRNTWKFLAEVDCDFDETLPQVLCHAGELNQVFLNIIVNAAHAIEAAGKPGLGRIHVATRRLGDEVVIRFEDTGQGVPQALRDRIFDPFFTTKEVGKGTGQGLAISRDVIVTKHGGRLEVGGREGEGAVFTIHLPLGHGDVSSEKHA